MASRNSGGAVLRWTALLVLCCAVCACVDSSSKRQESITIGESVVHAIKQYRSHHGTFPDTLGDLVPAYLASIPDPTWGQKEWVYTRTEQNRFSLAVGLNADMYPCLYYSSRNGVWIYDN